MENEIIEMQGLVKKLISFRLKERHIGMLGLHKTKRLDELLEAIYWVECGGKDPIKILKEGIDEWFC